MLYNSNYFTDIRPLLLNKNAATITKKVSQKEVKIFVFTILLPNIIIFLLDWTFRRYIHLKTYAPTTEIQKFLKKSEINRSAAVIKGKIQHLIKLKRN